MGVNSPEDQEILINTLNNFPTPSAPLEMEFSPSAPLEMEISPSAPPRFELLSATFKDEFECIVCMETQVIFLNIIMCVYICVTSVIHKIYLL